MVLEKFSIIYSEKLTGLYESDEAVVMRDLVFMHIFNTNRAGLSSIKKAEISSKQELLLNLYLERLITGEPVQYILGETWFYGLRLLVNPAVLIPRPETEFMADLIIKENTKPGLRILDVCTGSGCLAIAMKKNIPDSLVSAFDISGEALDTARVNASENHCEIDYFSFDLLNPAWEKVKGKFDIITANPPYVTEGERATMHVNVLEHEPSLALFVPDENPLIFYHAIALLAKHSLDRNGRLYMEINASLSREVADCFIEKGFSNVKVRKDLHGNDRYIIIG